jgi:deoxyribose-phosphate aldolase
MISRLKLAGMIDHSVLRPESTEDDVRKACIMGISLGVAAVVVNPAHIPLVVASLKGSAVKACSVISFPFGLSTTEAKLEEARNVLDQGAQEIDVVMNFSALRSGREDYVLNEIRRLTAVARSGSKKALVKVILETCYLTDSEKKKACLLAVKGGADFVKTSTGFGSAGATVEDVSLLRRMVGPNIGVKAAGGIRTLEQALQMVEAGANRIGTSSTMSILEGIRQ